MTDDDRERVLTLRKGRKLPWHNPPHLDFDVSKQYLISSTCYDHNSVIGKHFERMTECEAEVTKICGELSSRVYAWCILPNHYHVLLKTERIADLREALGEFHGQSSFVWNGEDNQRGRKVWFNCFERPMKSERHFWATLNYVHNNPVHHGYINKWQEWPWSSAAEFLKRVDPEKAKEIWRLYPILDYGKKWDI